MLDLVTTVQALMRIFSSRFFGIGFSFVVLR